MESKNQRIIRINKEEPSGDFNCWYNRNVLFKYIKAKAEFVYMINEKAGYSEAEINSFKKEFKKFVDKVREYRNGESEYKKGVEL